MWDMRMTSNPAINDPVYCDIPLLMPPNCIYS
ncbi:hypothetical protein PC118_g9470 [Phytophthora cactorum]|uniref:Uncharacterized protein n=1 Tax=Phytophthora cactorum TaxID=29920 RepID=A0A8T1G4J6_9STRA|nr:hypothetical protein PC118_g9470 [Phytophthora cactorum]KAG3245419.1 hypothetical protein PI124_g9836 [Phytophthora idaei]